MVLEFKLPDIGEGIAEGEIVKWHVSAGESVQEHQTVVEVMTDKATVEVPAPRAGTITELRAQEGETIPVGNVIFLLDESGGGGAASEPAASSSAGDSSAAQAAGASAEGGSATAVAPAPPAGGGGLLEFKLPDIGEGIAEGEIVKWHVAEGAEVKEHQTVVEVMTDKATVEVPSPAPGKVVSLLAAEGETVPVGQVIFKLETAGGKGNAQASAPAKAPAAAPEAKAKEAAGAAGGNGSAVSNGNASVLAVPSARRVARELGVELSQVSGTGRNGIVRRADVEAFVKTAPATGNGQGRAPAKAAPISIPAGERETRVPFRGVRRKIAEAMSRSKFTATHFTVVEEMDVTDLVKLRGEAKALGAEQGVKVTYMPFIMMAAAKALSVYPELNSQLDESTNEIVTFNYVNLGIATDTGNGLIVPVIPDVQAKGIMQLASELGELAARTREGKVKPDELRGGTFTITNAGNIGGILATPIINFPEVAILGVHRLMKRPGVVESPDGDRIEVRQYMNLSISVDHRIVDGASAARYLVHMKRLLENPGLLSL